MSSQRVAEATVAEEVLARWSRRAVDPAPLAADDVRSLFEAARWAPSAGNAQPWLFVYADSEPDLGRFRALVNDGNRRWADRAPLLVFVFARLRDAESGRPLRTAGFDTGAAWMALALQAHRLHLTTRAMGGIHLDRVHAALGVPETDYAIQCGIAIGRPAAPESLPVDLQAKERPTSRKPLDQVAVRGAYRD